MTFDDQRRYNRLFCQVIHKEGESEINYIKRFHNAEALEISVVNSYSGYQFMHNFLDNFHQGGKYSAQISRHQAELMREGTFVDKQTLSISDLQIDYLNFDSSVIILREKLFLNQGAFACRFTPS